MEVQWAVQLKEIAKNLPTDCWIAGGCLRSFLVGEKPKDIDIFSNNPEKVISYLSENDKFKKAFGNDFFQNFKYNNLTYQVIKKYTYETPQDTIDSFDFTIISAAFYKDELVLHDRFYLDNAQKRLVVNKLPFPLSSMKRSLKYVSRGYAMCPVNLSKILRAINELNIDWNNPDENQIDFYPDGTATFRGLD